MANKITMERGTTFALTVNYQENGIAADITGSTVRFTVKSSEYDTDTADAAALILKNVTSHTSPTTGVSTISLAPADTQSIVPGTYYYDVKITKSGGATYKLDEGRLVLGGSPTNRLV